MNIDRMQLNQFEDAAQLEARYGSVPRWRELLAAVRAGRAEFEDTLLKTGLLDAHGASTSSVHNYRAIEVHGFILGIVSVGRWDEVQTKAYLTYASHWIDDFFDSPAKVVDPARLLADRHDIRRALAGMGNAGQIGFAMAERARHPAAVFKALHRMLYGGLVQRSVERSQRRALVSEYLHIATQFVDAALVAEIRHLRPEAYWATNKTVLELLNAAEEMLDFNTSEAWNLIFAPALYYEDAEEERVNGELSFEPDDEPTVSDMLRMIRLGARRLARTAPQDRSRIRQLAFAARALPNLPEVVTGEYRSICTELGRFSRERRAQFGSARAAS